MMAAGFSAVPLNSSGRWERDRAVPRNARRAIRTAACITCLRRLSFRAKRPKMRNRTPKTQGMSAVLWVEPVRTNPAIPSRRYAKAKASVVEDMKIFLPTGRAGAKPNLGCLEAKNLKYDIRRMKCVPSDCLFPSFLCFSFCSWATPDVVVGRRGRINILQKWLSLLCSLSHLPGEFFWLAAASFKRWTNAVQRSRAPLPVTNRAFGGSQTSHQLMFFDQVVSSLSSQD